MSALQLLLFCLRGGVWKGAKRKLCQSGTDSIEKGEETKKKLNYSFLLSNKPKTGMSAEAEIRNALYT